jgi:hypothetical protein
MAAAAWLEWAAWAGWISKSAPLRHHITTKPRRIAPPGLFFGRTPRC